MANLETELFKEDFGTGACIGAIRKGPGDTIARIYQAQDGSIYSVINFPYIYKGYHIDKKKIDEYFRKKQHTLADEVEYAAKLLEKNLASQMANIGSDKDIQC